MKQVSPFIAALGWLWIGSGVCAPFAPLARAEGDAKAQPSPAADSEDPVLASFKGGAITLSDMQRAVAQKLRQTRAEIAAPGGRERFLAELIDHDLLAAEAERRGYRQHAKVIEAADRKSVETLLERGLAVEPTSISDADIAKHYEDNHARFHRPEMRRARHVQLASLEAANEVLALVKEGGAKVLSQLARERSTDERTRRQSGELGYFDREGRPKVGEQKIDPSLAAAVFRLRGENALAPAPVRTQGGYSVVMLVAQMDALDQSLRDVRETIRQELAEAQGEAALKALMAKLQAEVPTEVHPELLPAIALPEGRIGDRPQGFPAAPPDPRAPPKVVEPDGL